MLRADQAVAEAAQEPPKILHRQRIIAGPCHVNLRAGAPAELARHERRFRRPRGPEATLATGVWQGCKWALAIPSPMGHKPDVGAGMSRLPRKRA